jgi:SAM-dependent methyltransferase
MVSPGQESARTRARSFGDVAAAYAAHRPNYPDAAIDWALEPVAARAELAVLDLAAGTGKLTKSLLPRAGHVTAVEPDPDMLAVLRAQLGDRVTALSGTAESIPLPTSSVDAVLVGQAFHWFDDLLAGREIARVLRPGGVLAGLWNYEDGSVDWVRGYHEAASAGQRVRGNPAGGDHADLPAIEGLSGAERVEFGHSRRLTVDGLIDVLGTHSWMLMSTPEERARAYASVRGYFAARPDLTASGDGAFDLPLRTIVVRALRR